MQNLLFRICQKIWKDESMRKSWNEAIVVPIYKKGDKSIYENCRGISLINSADKVFARILLKRLTPYAEENLGRYQCGFRKGKSTIEQLTIIGQLIGLRYYTSKKSLQHSGGVRDPTKISDSDKNVHGKHTV